MGHTDDVKNHKKPNVSKNKSGPHPPVKKSAVVDSKSKKKSTGGDSLAKENKDKRKISQGHGHTGHNGEKDGSKKDHHTDSKAKDGKKKSTGTGAQSDKDKNRKKSSGKSLGNKSKGKDQQDKKHAVENSNPKDPHLIRQKQKQKSGNTKREGSLLLSGGSSLTSSFTKFDPGLPKFEYISYDYESRRNPCVIGSCTEASAARICSIFACFIHYSCLVGFITLLCILQVKGQNIFGQHRLWYIGICGPLSGMTALDCAVFYASYCQRAGPRFAHMACIHWLVCAILSLMVVILFSIFGFVHMPWIWCIYGYLRWIDLEVLSHNIRPKPKSKPNHSNQQHRTSKGKLEDKGKKKKESMAHNREQTERGGYSYAL